MSGPAVRSIHRILIEDAARLAQSLALNADEARREVQLLLYRTSGMTRATLLAHPEILLSEPATELYQRTFARRLLGEPIAYILGEREFYGLLFEVSANVLIPRPETELLVELALERVPPDEPVRVLDLASGSGCIAVALAKHRPTARLVASDVSAAALLLAQRNAQRQGTGNIEWLQSDWFAVLGGRRFNLIVSNPPYVRAGDPHLRAGDLRFEPPGALVAGANGLEAIETIVRHAPAHLQTDGWLLLEHGHDQSEAVHGLLGEAGFGEIFSRADLAGIPRVTGGRRLTLAP